MGKPLKRHPFIVEFSRDHHFGLLLVWKIRQGINKGVEQDRIKKYVCYYMQRELFSHFDEEEKHLLPLLPSNDKLRQQVIAEHDRMRELASRFSNNQAAPEELILFADLLEAHIRFEERVFFPRLETVSNGFESFDVSAISTHTTSRTASDEEWTDNFWEHTGNNRKRD